MKILLLTNYFPPEVGTGPHMPHELGESLVKRGHEVTVVTGFPRYNVPEMPEKYRGRMRFEEEISGMQVLRINAMNFYGRSFFSRGMVQFLNPPMLALQAMIARKPDLVFTISPPLLMGVLARLVALRFHVPCVVNIQDLFPQAVIDLGILKNKPLIKIFEWMERYVYRSATALTAMSDGNRAFMISRGAPPEKVHTVFNWVDVDAIQPGLRMNDFRRQHGLGDQFVVLFAGTMGVSQGLEVVVNAARQLAYVPDLLFLLIGEGVECPRLKHAAEGLKNVRSCPCSQKTFIRRFWPLPTPAWSHCGRKCLRPPCLLKSALLWRPADRLLPAFPCIATPLDLLSTPGAAWWSNRPMPRPWPKPCLR